MERGAHADRLGVLSSVASRRPGIGRGMALSVAAAISIGVGQRAAIATPFLATAVTAVVALSALGIGLCLHARNHSRTWITAWMMLAVALALDAVATTTASVGGWPTTFPAPVDWIGVASGLLAIAAVCSLFSTRDRAGAMDMALQGLVVACVCTYVPWASAGTRGVGQLDAVASLLPMGVWIVALWVLLRLMFLTNERIVAYRFLAAGFLCFVVVDAALAIEHLGGAIVDRDTISVVTLSAFLLWGAASLHPSVRSNFAPAPPRTSHFGSAKVLLCLLAVAFAPATLVVFVRVHGVAGLEGLVAASAIVPGLVAVYLTRQIRDRAHAEQRAQHDALTGLPNRTLFRDRVEGALAQARRSGSGIAVMFLDLDHFKAINDSLGHGVGDNLIQAVAKRLRETVRETDTVARMGGDEFTVLVSDAKDKEAAVAAATKIIDVFSQPFLAGSHELHTSTSIGVALYPSDGTDVEALLKHADSAMYRAKARGRNAFELFTPDLSIRAKARHSVETGLRQAIDRNGLELHFQPQVDVGTGAIVGLEALARWPHPEIGLVMPEVFVPIAEETGLIVPLGDWAINAAVAALRGWVDAGIAARPVAVNVSARHLSETSFIDKVARILDSHDIQPDFLELEITESVFMRDLSRMTATLLELRDLGVRLSIDDFGTGFSGLSYLAGLPIDSLKIDQSFVAHVRRASDYAPIIDAIIGLAHALHLNVVAEGVESVEQARFLIEHGCSEMQGYLFNAACPAEEIADLLAVDDRTTINWLGDRDDLPAREPRSTTSVRPARASVLLAAICGGKDIERRDHAEIAEILGALVRSERVPPTPARLRTMSKRFAGGTLARVVPLSTRHGAAPAVSPPIPSAATATPRDD
ncbi:MAG: hypothetical protein QOG50_2291 [Actinomycetota bacterium]|nr:hypothetical protein [Actinomycetota bacterium]